MEKFVELCAQDSLDQEERVRLVEGLLDRGELDLGRKDNNGWYPIHYAAQYGRLDVVALFLRHCDPHLETRATRSTALHVACANGRLDVVEALLRFCQDGAPPKKDRDGNTPLHLACKVGSLQITNRLLGKYPTKAIEANKNNVTPLGFAVRSNNVPVGRLLLQRSSGNPARKFPDFRQYFPGFKHKLSLDHPVTIFVMGNRKTGKSTLIKSLQVEGYLNRAIGVIKSTSGVEHHSGGVVPSDVSSSGYGRAKFYELASGYQTTQENIFLSTAEPAHTIFLIVLSFKDERREMEAHMHYWLSFIHHQYRSRGGIKLNVAVVGSFLFYNKFGSIRLDNRHRLHLVYHHVLSSESHRELCSHFHFLGKYSMDCRKSESPGLTQLRNVLSRKSHELRPSGGEQNVPSFCYVLLSALYELLPVVSDLSVLKLSEIVHYISQSVSSGQMHSLLSLLPPSEEDLKPYLEILEERKAIVVINHIDPRDPWIIFDEYTLLSHIDGTLIQKVLQMSTTSHLANPAIMSEEELLECLSSTSLDEKVLLNILHNYKTTEVMLHGNITRYFLPSVLKFTKIPLPSWNSDDPKYNFGFAWCVVPKPDQTLPFFMPRFLYFLLYELFTSTEEGDMDKVVISESSLYCKQATELEIYIAIDSKMVNLHMRCEKGEEVTCLKYRNVFLSAIHQQRELLQPNLKVNEYIIPMGAVQFPIKKIKHIKPNGSLVSELRNAIVTRRSNESVQSELCFEPFIWCNNLSEVNLRCLLDPRCTNVPVSKEFLQDLSQQVGDKWEVVVNSTNLLQVDSSDTNTSADEEESGTKSQMQDPQLPQYGQILEFFSTMSLFRSTSQFLSALKNPQQYGFTPVHSSQDRLNRIDAVNIPQSTIQGRNAEQQSMSDCEISASIESVTISSTSKDIATYKVREKHPQLSVLTCSSTSEMSSHLSTHMDVPEVEGERCSHPTSNNIHFICNTEQIQCSNNGAKFQHKVHGITFYVPPGAVNEGSYIILEFGVAIAGPFTYPDNIMPVSPILWVQLLCNSDQGELKKPMEITISHAVNCNEGSSLLHFMCAKKQKQHVTFQRTHKQAMISPNKATLLSKLSKQQYFFCIGGKCCREIIARTQYCIIHVSPKQSIKNLWKVHFFITYALPACNEIVSQQYGSDYTLSTSNFHFDTSDERKPSIHVDFQRILPDNWMIMKEGTYPQIEPIHVDFRRLNFETGEISIHHTYPPSFTIVIDGHRAVQESIAIFEFKGTLPANLVYEVPLTHGSFHHPPKTGSYSEIPEKLIHRKSSVGNLSIERVESIHSMPKETDKEMTMNILVDNFTFILEHLDQKILRPVLFEQKALSDSEYEKLLSLSTSDGTEYLLLIMKKKGIKGFEQFMVALKKTSHKNTGHNKIFETLKARLTFQQDQLLYAAQIISVLSTQ